MVTRTSVELGGVKTELGLSVEDSDCTELCKGSTVTTEGLGLVDGMDKEEDSTGDGDTGGIREVLTDETEVLLGWGIPVPDVPRGLPAGSWK
jgi:hypothetical protein